MSIIRYYSSSYYSLFYCCYMYNTYVKKTIKTCALISRLCVLTRLQKKKQHHSRSLSFANPPTTHPVPYPPARHPPTTHPRTQPPTFAPTPNPTHCTHPPSHIHAPTHSYLLLFTVRGRGSAGFWLFLYESKAKGPECKGKVLENSCQKTKKKLLQSNTSTK